MATTIADNILLKSYGARSEYGPDIPLSAFVVIIKLFQIILNIACGITAGALPIMGYNYGAKLYTDFAVGCLRIYLSLVVFTCLQKACAMFLQSIGHAKAAVPLSVLRDVLLIVLAILMPMRMGIMGILWSAPAADAIAMAVTAAVVAQVWRRMGADGRPETERTIRSHPAGNGGTPASAS